MRNQKINKVKDTFHNAISIGEVGQDLVLVNKKLMFSLK